MNFPEIGTGKLISVTNIHRLSDDGGRITSRRYEADYHTHRLLNSGVFCAISSSRQQAPDNNVIRFDTKPSLNLVCANFDDYGPVSIVSLDGAFHQGLNIPHMIRCQNCETNYPTKYQYQRHQCEFNAERVVLKPNADLMNLDKNQQRVKYDCPTCGKQFVSKNNLDRHQASHKSSKENTCEHCNKQFVSENRLRIHKENHCKKAGDISKFYRSDVTVWKCRKCQEVFSSSTTAGFHIEICDEFMDLSSTALADDRATTADENGVVDLTTVKKEPFSQQQPQDGANNGPQQLTSTTTSSPISTNHEQQRLCSGVATATPTTTTATAALPIITDCKIIEKISTELLLQCEFCNRTYADKSVLLRHQKTHKTDRNYECAICKDSFTSYVSATQHWLRKCSEKANLFYLPKLTYCEFCDRTFKSHEILYTHKIKKKHYTPKTHAGIREMTNEAAESLDRSDNNNNDDTTGNNGDRHNIPTSDECPVMMMTNGSNGNGRFIKNEGVIDKLIEDVLIALEIPINSKHSLSGDSKCSMNRNHNNNNDNDKENVEDFIREIKREPQNPTEDEKSNENDNDYSATEETNDIDNNNNNNNTKNNNDNNNNNNNNDDDNNNNNNNNDNNNNKNNNNNNDNDNDDNNNNNMSNKDQHQLEKKKRGRKRKMNNNKHQNSSGKSKRMFADYPDEGFKFQCERCDKVWDTVIDLEDHREREHAANYSCDECGQVLHSARALLIHSRAHKSLKPYVCETCGRSYSQTSHLWQHMRFHQGIKPFACPHEGCEARYTIRPDLKDHIRKVHTRERPFKCNVCGKCFLTGSVYYQHRLIHTEDRRYGCDMCEKRFFRADALNNHKRIHTNERPYPCFVCGRMFRQKGDRNKHFRTQHPDAIMN